MLTDPKPESEPRIAVPITISLEIIAEIPAVDEIVEGRGTYDSRKRYASTGVTVSSARIAQDFRRGLDSKDSPIFDKTRDSLMGLTRRRPPISKHETE